MRTLIVDNKYDGKKLNNIILSEFKNLHSNSLYKALRKKDIKINGVRTSENKVVNRNDKIEIYISDELLFGSSDVYLSNIYLSKENIIYEDKNIIAIDKPIQIEVVRRKFFNRKIIYTFGISCISVS